MIKRLIDIIFSGLILIVTSPVFFLCIMYVWFFAGWPVFVAMKRQGRGNTVFRQIKFRTMFKGNHELKDYEIDYRVIPALKFLRQTGLDSLPEVVNVFLGDMSMVGPRPFPLPLIAELREIDDLSVAIRNTVKPGITGMAQLNRSKFVDAREKLFVDLFYIKTQSVWLDIWLLARTVARMLTIRWEK